MCGLVKLQGTQKRYTGGPVRAHHSIFSIPYCHSCLVLTQSFWLTRIVAWELSFPARKSVCVLNISVFRYYGQTPELQQCQPKAQAAPCHFCGARMTLLLSKEEAGVEGTRFSIIEDWQALLGLMSSSQQCNF